MGASILQSAGLIALGVAMIVTLYEMGQSLRPMSCSECPHCMAIAEQEKLAQERLSRDYARRLGLENEDDDRRID